MEPEVPTTRIPGRRAADEGSDVEVRDEDARPAGGKGGGFHLYGVVRSGARWQVLRRRATDPDPLPRVRFRDLEALVRRTGFELPPLDKDALLAHQRVVDETMRRETILPAPFGVVFRGRREVIAFLEDQYLVLDEALSLVDGHWELRLHLSFAGDDGHADVAASVYGELRRYARAALPFPPEGERIFSAAFLVERAHWVDFWERAEDMGVDHPDLVFDLTGPWPPYDFVRMVP